jgi:hypothetical protein
MKTVFLLPAFFFLCGSLSAQNLVPNPSFEEYTECPTDLAQITRATGWQVQGYSPDYFNACAGASIVGVPSNGLAYQLASTGVAYAGIITYSDSTVTQYPELAREHIGIYLTQPLVPGMPVYLSFKTAPGLIGNLFNTSNKWTCKDVGMKFTMQPLDIFDPQLPDNKAAIHLNQLLADTVNWTLVKGVYVPDSAYQYMVIGNFFEKDSIQPTLINPNGNQGFAYSLIDDICVSYDSMTYLHVGLGTLELSPLEKVTPNPFGSFCEVSFGRILEAEMDLTLFDAVGQIVRSYSAATGTEQIRISGEDLPTGAYTLSMSLPTGFRRSVILVHVSP